MLQVTSALLHWLVWGIGRRFKNKLGYMIAMIYVTEHLLITLTTELLAKEENKAPNVQMMVYRMTSFY